MQVSAWTLLAGALVLAPLGLRTVPTRAWPVLIGLAVVSTYLPVFAYYSGLRTVDATPAAIVANATIEPVVALGIGAAAQDERLSVLAVLGGALVLGVAAWSARGP